MNALLEPNYQSTFTSGGAFRTMRSVSAARKTNRSFDTNKKSVKTEKTRNTKFKSRRKSFKS